MRFDSAMPSCSPPLFSVLCSLCALALPLGSAALCVCSRWRTQGFLFSANPRTRFGLTQTAGGPCGVLAPVQAWILLRLLFGGAAGAPGGDRAPSPAVVAMNDDIPLAPTQAQQDEALVWALTNVIQRCAPKGNQQGFSLVSGDERSLHLTRVGRIEEVTAFWTSHLPQLHSPLGVLPFVYSVLLTRGLAQLRSDMDDPSSYLVGNFGHSSQELVNLMMIGRAVTNVFDGEKVLGDAADPTAFRLKGVPAQNEIGFLTLLEALRYSTVGEYYKSPRFPIWVVGSSNHYTVMFSLDRRVGALTPKQMKQRAARSAFDEMDPENNGFIPVANLAALLAKLGVQVPQGMTQPEVQRRLDPDGLGVMLYERVLTVLEQWGQCRQQQQPQQAAGWRRSCDFGACAVHHRILIVLLLCLVWVCVAAQRKRRLTKPPPSSRPTPPSTVRHARISTPR